MRESNTQQREESLFDDRRQLESLQQERRQKGTDTCYLGTEGVAKKRLLHLLHEATGVLVNRIPHLGQAASSVKVGTKDWEVSSTLTVPISLWQGVSCLSTSHGCPVCGCLLSSSAGRGTTPASANAPGANVAATRRPREEGCRQMFIWMSTRHTAWALSSGRQLLPSVQNTHRD